MSFPSPTLGWLLSLLLAAQGPSPLTVKADVSPRKAYVGQQVTLTVSVELDPGSPEPTVSTPKLAKAVVTRAESGEVSANGKRRSQVVFVVVPRVAGTLSIPSVGAKVGDRSGRSAPLRMEVAGVPAAGRTADYLGGVGPFELVATARPAEIRVGETTEYVVTVTGPGSLGLDAGPGLGRLKAMSDRVEITPGPDRAESVPPSHTFTYRLRPTRPGELTLPPVTVSGFDPLTARFLTKVSQGVTVRVRDVRRFEPGPLASPGAPESGGTPARSSRGRTPLILSVLASLVGLAVVGWRLRTRRSRGGSRRLKAVLSRIEKAKDETEAARAVTEGLATFLRLATGRPEGALTPEEAREGVGAALGSDPLADRARRLIERCDRAQYGLRQGEGSLGDEGRRFLTELWRERLRR